MATLVLWINRFFIPLKVMDMVVTTTLLARNFQTLTKKSNPFATLVLTLIICNSGTISMSILTSNQPLTQALFFNGSQNQIFWSSLLLIWWLSFYSPFNSFQSATEKQPLRFILCFGKEVLRCRKIWRGIQIGSRFVGKNDAAMQVFLGFVNARDGRLWGELMNYEL